MPHRQMNRMFGVSLEIKNILESVLRFIL